MSDLPSKYLFNNPPHRAVNPKVQLLRIIIEKDHTRIDLGYQATDYYNKGGWVRMSEKTYIRVLPDGDKLTITGAENIPIGKTRHEFKTTKDWLYFNLYFPPIPFKTCKIELIEKEKTDGTDFNFYDIELKISEAIRLL
jgi:hypothetical protein